MSLASSCSLQDVFHIGEIDVDIGNAFACTGIERMQKTYTRSPSGITVNSATVSFPKLVNRDGKSK